MRRKIQGAYIFLSYFFICFAILLNLINKHIMGGVIPEKILDYSFWFGLGFFMNYIIFSIKIRK